MQVRYSYTGDVPVRKSKLVPITLRVPEEVRDGLDRLQTAFDLKRPAMISLLVREKLATMESSELEREVEELKARVKALEEKQ